MDPYNATHRDRLSTALARANDGMEPYRKGSAARISDFAGSLFPKGSKKKTVPTVMNLMRQLVDALMASMAANNPRADIRARTKDLRPWAYNFKVTLNNELDRINLRDVMRECLHYSIFSLGIAKSQRKFSNYQYNVDPDGELFIDPGEFEVTSIGIEDWVHDLGAKKMERCQFMGDRFRMRYDRLFDGDVFDQDAAKMLSPTSKHDYKETSFAQDVKAGSITDEDEIDEYVDLVNVWLVEERQLCTFGIDPNFRLHKTPPLAVVDMDDVFGPYDFLNLGAVPGATMPSTLADQLSYMHDLINSLLRKVARQASAAKKVFTYTGGDVKDAERLRKAADGSYLKVDGTGVEERRMDGPDAAVGAFVSSLVGNFDRMSGNLAARAGLGPSAGTVGQEQIIQGQVNRSEAATEILVREFVERVVKKVARNVFEDPLRDMPGMLEFPGLPYSAPAEWAPEDRQGTFLDYNVEISWQSVAHKSPQDRLNFIRETVNQLFPMMQVLAAQGIEFDAPEFVEQIAELGDEAGIMRLFRKGGQRTPGAATEQELRQSPNTTRTTKQVRIPGASQQQMQTREQEGMLDLARAQQKAAA